jgi:tetratricopeptide (TPR) repeat protein
MRFGLDGRLVLGAALFGACAVHCVCAQDDPTQRALTLVREGKIVEAEGEFKELARQHPTSPEPLAELGLLEARQEHYAEAVAWYRKAMALSPEMPRLRFNLGLAYFKAGEYREALQQLTPLLKAEPADSDEGQRLTILIGMSHYGLGEFVAATPYLKQAAGGDAQNLSLLLTLAHSCLLSKQYQCVLDQFHRIIALSPDSAEAHMLAGEALDEMREPVDATRELRAAVQADPKAPNVHFALGYLLWTQGHAEEAAKEFQAQLDNVPQHALAMLYLADAEIQMNQFEPARPLLEKVVKATPGNAMGHLDLGIVDEETGQREAALRELKETIALKPDDVKAHWRLARLYRSMGKTAEAKVELDKSRTLNETADEKLLKIMSTVPQQNGASQGAAPAGQNK